MGVKALKTTCVYVVIILASLWAKDGDLVFLGCYTWMSSNRDLSRYIIQMPHGGNKKKAVQIPLE